jgi:small subunit ribosomal protein S18
MLDYFKNNNTEESEIKFLTPLNLEVKTKKKYCFFKKFGIKYIDYKDPNFLIKFLNAQGKILPRRITGTSKKNQRKLSISIKRARYLGFLPFITDDLR